MHKKFLFKILILFTFIFFLVQVLSQLLIVMAKDVKSPNDQVYYKLAHYLLPLDFNPVFHYGLSLQKNAKDVNNNEMLLKSVAWFKKTIARNPLHFNAHFGLGKSYNSFSDSKFNYFNEAVEQYKKAAVLRSRHYIIALENSKILLSMWPLLKTEDKEFCKNLLIQNIKNFKWEEMQVLIEYWWLYVKDFEFLNRILQENPIYYQKVAYQLIGFHVPIEYRWKLLNAYELSLIEKIKDILNSSYSFDGSVSNYYKLLLDELGKIKGYYLLSGDENFPENEIMQLKSRLLLGLLEAFSKEKRLSEKEFYEVLDTYVYEFIQKCDSHSDLLDLGNWFEQSGLFQQKHLKILIIKNLISFKIGRNTELINEIEELRRNLAFVAKENQHDYIRVLDILAEAYITANMLYNAETIFKEMIKIDPDRLQTYWNLICLQKILGDEEKYNQAISGQIDQVRATAVIDVMNIRSRQTVYLTDQNSIKIKLNQAVFQKIQDKKILMVFVNGNIQQETYIGDLAGDELEIIVNPDFQCIKQDVYVIFY
jgi:hypothetical protein